MKSLKFTSLLLVLFVFTSCTTVRVVSDYDRQANFNEYKSFAFYKPGIDKAEISDLDKKRILRAINSELAAKGMNKSESPDLLVSIFTKERERINVYNNNFGWGWGWNRQPAVSTSTEGVLFVDLIDANKKELVWQGSGTGYLTNRSVEKKEERIKEFVSQIMEKYPPEMK